MTRPEVGGHVLPPVGGLVDPRRPVIEMGGKRYQNLARHQELRLPWDRALKEGYLEATGKKDAAGNPIYGFLPGDNGDLGLFAEF